MPRSSESSVHVAGVGDQVEDQPVFLKPAQDRLCRSRFGREVVEHPDAAQPAGDRELCVEVGDDLRRRALRVDRADEPHVHPGAVGEIGNPPQFVVVGLRCGDRRDVDEPVDARGCAISPIVLEQEGREHVGVAEVGGHRRQPRIPGVGAVPEVDMRVHDTARGRAGAPGRSGMTSFRSICPHRDRSIVENTKTKPRSI